MRRVRVPGLTPRLVEEHPASGQASSQSSSSQAPIGQGQRTSIWVGAPISCAEIPARERRQKLTAHDASAGKRWLALRHPAHCAEATTILAHASASLMTSR